MGALWDFLQSGVVHATSLGRYNLLFLILLAGTLTQCKSLVVILPRWQTAVTGKVPNCNRGSFWGVELVALEASAAVSGNGVPTAAVAVVV